jgi:hypothetical protein
MDSFYYNNQPNNDIANSYNERSRLKELRRLNLVDRRTFYDGKIIFMPQGKHTFVGTYPKCKVDGSYVENTIQIEHVVPKGSLGGTDFTELSNLVLAMIMYTDDHYKTLSYGGGGKKYREEVKKILRDEKLEIGNPIYTDYAPKLQSNYSKALAYVLIGYFERGLLYRYALLIIGGLIFSFNRLNDDQEHNDLLTISSQDMGVLIELVETLFNFSRIYIDNGDQIHIDGFEAMRAKLTFYLPEHDLESVCAHFEYEVDNSFTMINEELLAGNNILQYPWPTNFN